MLSQLFLFPKTFNSLAFQSYDYDRITSLVFQGSVVYTKLDTYVLIQNHFETRLFADDTILFRKIKNTKNSDLLQQDLSALKRWEKEWQMSFNLTKCIVIRVSPSKTKLVLPTHYQLHGHILEVVEASKYLGVTITNDLSWNRHIDRVAAKGNQTLGFIRRNL